MCQVIYSYFGPEFFPFSTFNTFSKKRALAGQVIYRIVSEDDTYREEGIAFEVHNKVFLLHKIKKVPLERLEDYFPYPIIAIDEFQLKKRPNGSLFQKKRIYRKRNVQ